MSDDGVDRTCVKVSIIPDSNIRKNMITIATIVNVSIMASFIMLLKIQGLFYLRYLIFLFSLHASF
jgi:hypothetical protein